MSMFDRYPQPDDYIPNNRPHPVEHKKLTIMAGETTSHSFEVPFDVLADTSSCSVIYKLGTKVIIEKTLNVSNDVLFDEVNHKSIITCVLSPEETMLFANTVLTAKVQLKFIMLDQSVAYSESYRIKLLNSLESNQM